jgi:hypothetical protein
LRSEFRHRSRLSCLAILRSASWIVPTAQREEWLAEWRSELWYFVRKQAEASSEATRGAHAAAFCLGAYKDAFWLRSALHKNGSKPHVEGPIACLAILGLIAAATELVFASLVTRRHIETGGFLEHAVLMTSALAFLPATTTVSWEDTGSVARGLALQAAVRWWLFVVAKIFLLTVVAFCGSFSILAALSSGQIQPHGVLVGYWLAFRWAFTDQRQRCPICLRSFAYPTRIGDSSRTLLEWFGTEFVCRSGHSLLYIPEPASSYCSAPRWTYLDSSWKSLFRL